MSKSISRNTQAILLLTAPLIVGRGRPRDPALRPLSLKREYSVLANRLHEVGREPADLLGADAGPLLDECLGAGGPRLEHLERGRIESLLGRGLQLSLAVERWETRAIWVLSRADSEYPRRLKRRLGQLAYIWAGLRTAWCDRGFDVELALDEAAPRPVHASMLVVGNTRNYGAIAHITAQASVADGELDYVAFLGHGPWNAARTLPRLMARRHLGARGVLFRRARAGRITPAPGGLLPHVQLDGEVGLGPSAGPITLTAEAGAVRMLVPRPDHPLFAPPPARPGPAGSPPSGAHNAPPTMR